MHNIISRRTSSIERDRLNANLFEQSLSSHIYNRWIPAVEFESVATTTAATWTPPDDSVFPSWALGDSDRYSIGAYIPRDREWRSGIVTLSPHLMFGDDTGDTAIYVHLWSIEALGTVNAWPVAGSANDKIIEATATAFTLYRVPEEVFLSNSAWTVQVNDATIGIQVVIGRNGADGDDTMTGDVYVLGATLKYIEGEKAIGEAYDPIRR